MSSYSQHEHATLKRRILRDWKAKLAALVIAVAIWAVIKRQVDIPEVLPPGGAGGGTGYRVKTMEHVELIAMLPKLTEEEPSWFICGEFVRKVLVFRPADSNLST